MTEEDKQEWVRRLNIGAPLRPIDVIKQAEYLGIQGFEQVRPYDVCAYCPNLVIEANDGEAKCERFGIVFGAGNDAVWLTGEFRCSAFSGEVEVIENE